MTIDLSDVEEGTTVQHKETGEEKQIVGFVKDFSGERNAVKLGWVDGDSSAVASVGTAQIPNDKLNEWEVVE